MTNMIVGARHAAAARVQRRTQSVTNVRMLRFECDAEAIIRVTIRAREEDASDSEDWSRKMSQNMT